MVFQILAFCAGAGATLTLPAIWPPVVFWLVSALGLLLLRRSLACAALCIGIAWTAFSSSRALQDDWPCARDREIATVVGHVITPAIVRDGRTDFDFDIAQGPDATRWPMRVRVSWYEPTAIPLPGQQWRMTLRLRCRSGMANPGAPDRELDLLRQGIGATAYTVAHSPPERLFRGDRPERVEKLRARIATGIATQLPGSVSGTVLQGLSVGARGAIPEALWDAFTVTGLAHLMAISGLHVTGCAVFVLFLMRAAWRLPVLSGVTRRIGVETGVVLIVTAVYTELSGASLPALRTLAMVTALATLRVSRRAQPMPQLLAAAALVLIGLDPLALTSAGFWLSFIATAALLSLIECGAGWRAKIAAFGRAQFAMLVVLMPVLAAAFGRVSLIAPAANAVAIPLFSVLLLPAVLLGTAADALNAGAAAPVWRALAAVLDPLWPGIVALASWQHASWAPVAQPWPLIDAAAVAVLAALVLPLPGLRVAALALLGAILAGAPPSPMKGGWTLSVLDVGQGLAAVVQTNRHVLVFDTGPGWRGGGTAARVSLLPFLRSRGIRRIDRLVISHPDRDHAGGVAPLAAAIPIAAIMTAPGDSTSPGDLVCRRGDRWHWDGIRFEVLHPPSGLAGGDNDRSCALRISGAGGSALLLADPEFAAERELQALPIAADVVLLPHHGSRTSSSPELIRAVSARLGIASAGFGNRWAMPAPEVVSRWREAGTTVLVTADAGAVEVRFAAEQGAIAVHAERRANRRWWRRGAAG